MGLSAWAAWCLVCTLMGVAHLSTADAAGVDCTGTTYDKQVAWDSTCNPTCRSEVYGALSGIYQQLGVDLDDQSINRMSDPWRPWTSSDNSACAPCHLGSQNAYNFPAAQWGLPMPGEQLLPSFCCWPGADCCVEYAGNEYGSTINCSTLSVVSFSLPSLNLEGTLDSIMPQLDVLTRRGMRGVDLASNMLRGTIPPSLGALDRQPRQQL